MHLPLLLWDGVLGGDLVTHAVILLGHIGHLLLQVLHIAVFGCELLLEFANLSRLASLLKTGTKLGTTRLSLQSLDFFLKAENIEDHDICSVENEGKEEGESAEVHVTLRVELASLNFHTLGTTENTRSLTVALGLSSELDLDAVDAIDRVDEKDENEYEGNLHTILQFRNQGALRYEGKQLATPCERDGHDEGHEHDHLHHKE